MVHSEPLRFHRPADRSRSGQRGSIRYTDNPVFVADRMRATMDVAVAIIGAGPAGLLAANVLVRAGIGCAVFERLSELDVRARARAGLIDIGTAALLQRHGSPTGCCGTDRGAVRASFGSAAPGTCSTTPP